MFVTNKIVTNMFVTDALICADTVVHLRRAHGWSATAYRSLIVDTLAALTRERA